MSYPFFFMVFLVVIGIPLLLGIPVTTLFFLSPINIMNISVTSTSDTYIIDLRKSLSTTWHPGDIDIIVELSEQKLEPLPNLSILILEELLKYDWIYPVLKAKGSGSISLVNQYVKRSHMGDIICEREQVIVYGIYIDTAIIDSICLAEELILRHLSELDVHDIFIMKYYVLHMLRGLNLKPLIKFPVNSSDILTLLKLLGDGIRYFKSYIDRFNILPYYDLYAIKPIIPVSSSSVNKSPVEYNTKALSFLGDRILWFKSSSKWNIALLADLFAINWLYEWELLMTGHYDDTHFTKMISLHNTRILHEYYKDSRMILVKYFKNKLYPNVDVLSKPQMQIVNRNILKHTSNLSSVPPNIIKMRHEFNELLSSIQKIDAYKQFIKRWKLIDDDNDDYIYDSDGYPVICSHRKPTNDNLDRYYMMGNNVLYCKICGDNLLDIYKWSLSFRDDAFYYSDINFNIKSYTWKEIIKILPFLQFKQKIVTSSLIQQLVEILYPILMQNEKRILMIKTLQIIEKYGYFKIITYIYIWCLLVHMRLTSKTVFKFTFEVPGNKIEDQVYDKLSELIDYSRYNFLDERKFNSIYLNILSQIKAIPLSIEYKLEQDLLLYYTDDNNALMSYIHSINKLHKRSLDNLTPVNNELVWNIVLSYINFVSKNTISATFIQTRQTTKESLNKKINRSLSYPTLYCVNDTDRYYHDKPYDISRLNLIYGLTTTKQFHRHKWSKVLYTTYPAYKGFHNISTVSDSTGTYRIVIDIECTICKLTLSKIKTSADTAAAIHVQQQITNFYNRYVVLCPKEGIHDFKNGKCTKCSMTFEDIDHKNFDTFIKHVPSTAAKQSGKPIPVNILHEQFKVIKKHEYKNYEPVLTQWINKVILSTKNYSNVKHDALYSLLFNLGTSKREFSSGMEYIRILQLHTYMQCILHILNRHRVYTVKYEYTYDHIQSHYDVNNHAMLLIIELCKILLIITVPECINDILDFLVTNEKYNSVLINTVFELTTTDPSSKIVSNNLYDKLDIDEEVTDDIDPEVADLSNTK